MYQYFYVHVVALLGSICCAAWFGACYYFEVSLKANAILTYLSGICNEIH